MVFKARNAGIILLYFSPVLLSYGQNIPVSLNGQALAFNKDVPEYSFLVAGHIYGSHNKSVYPSASITANIQMINGLEPDFMVLLGDIVRLPNKHQISLLRKSFLNKLAFPVFNAPGNHDVADRAKYVDNFGRTYFSFRYSTEIFIFLDGEIDNGRIKDEQLEFLVNSIETCRNNPNVYIYSFFHIVCYGPLEIPHTIGLFRM